jgi:Protein of unknown function (DUF2971)
MEILEDINRKKPEGPIYHYTSIEDILGIIESLTLWASKIQYLNDEKEFRYALELLDSRLIKSLNPSDTRVRKFMEKLNLTIYGFRNVNVFVCGFSEIGDLLSQWRGYCPPGKGYCIGFRYEHLEKQLEKQNCRLLPCLYDREKQLQLIDEFILRNKVIIDEIYHANDDRLVGLSYLLIDNFMEIAPIIKHHSFSEEQEWRIITKGYWSDINIKFRAGKSTIIPYYEFNLANNFDEFNFEEIIIGPTPHQELSRNSIHGFLFSKKMSINYKIRSSEIPYRDW